MKNNGLFIGASVGAAALLALVIWFSWLALSWGAARFMMGKGFWNFVLYANHFAFGVLWLFAAAAGSVTAAFFGSTWEGADDKIPHFVNIVLLTPVCIWGGYVACELVRFGGMIWWTGVFNTINSMSMIFFGCLFVASFVAAIGTYVFFMIKRFF